MRHVACMRDKKNTHNISVDKNEGSDHLEALRVEAITILKLILKSFMECRVAAVGSYGDSNLLGIS